MIPAMYIIYILHKQRADSAVTGVGLSIPESLDLTRIPGTVSQRAIPTIMTMCSGECRDPKMAQKLLIIVKRCSGHAVRTFIVHVQQ